MSLAEPYIAILATTFNITLAVVSTIAHVIWWPINHLLHVLVILASPLWNLLCFLLLPFVRFGQAIIAILSLPFSVKWLERIETIYVFLGTAALIGTITGTLVYIVFKFLSSSLKIDSTIVPRAAPKGRTAAEYRAAKRTKHEGSTDHSPAASPVLLKKVPGPRRRPPTSQAIIEEDESDF